MVTTYYPNNPNYRPVWDVWTNVPVVALWEAVALSMDCDPREVIVAPSGPGKTDDRPIGPPAYRDRLQVAVRHAQYADSPLYLAKVHEGINEEYTAVRLLDFAHWAINSVEWEVPDRLNDLARQFISKRDSRSRRGPRWPWGTHETKLLRDLAAAAQRYWVEYDPKDVGTAPTNDEVAEWLNKANGTPMRVAEIMAQILRAENIPRGPRPKE